MTAQPLGAGSSGSGRGWLFATYLVLAAIGMVLGVIESFLVPQRIFGGIEGLAVVLGFFGNAMVGSLGGVGTRTAAGAVVPVVSWAFTVGVLMIYAPGGDVVFAGKLPVDPGVVVTGVAFPLIGILAGAVSLVVTVRYTGRVNAPTPQT